MRPFDELIAEARDAPFEGWDFSYLAGRLEETAPSWSLSARIRARMASPLLDMGTGGGEFLSTFAPFGGMTLATEAWPPNVSVAARRLRARGAHVVQVEPAPDNDLWSGRGGRLPFRDQTFRLITNRHEAFSPTEVFRVLRPGGTFLTQQVGAEDDRELRERYEAGEGRRSADYAGQLRAAGFHVIDDREELLPKTFRDVGAVAWYMKAISWEFPGYDVEGSRELLAEIHAHILEHGGLVVHDHRILVEARRP